MTPYLVSSSIFHFHNKNMFFVPTRLLYFVSLPVNDLVQLEERNDRATALHA